MNSKLLSATFSIMFLASSWAQGQTNPRYLILFKDKASSPYAVSRASEFLSEKAIARRNKQNISITENDFPPNPEYLTAIKNTGASVIFPSRWFNGVLVEASATQLASIQSLSFFKGIEGNHPLANLTSPSSGVSRVATTSRVKSTDADIDYGLMKQQLALIGVDQLHNLGFQGENMLIGVLDAGFSRADQLTYMKPVFDENRIVDTYDFVSRETDVYDDDSHGINALSTIAANQPGTMVGAAFKASFALYRSENVSIESPYEEVTWLLAAERADSVGVDIISSSLGYNIFEGEFDSDEYNYTYQDMDGKTTIISRAARYAAQKGIMVVSSAGNEGNNSWRYITAPADVDSVVSVGATTLTKTYAAFSSIGPNALGQMKPDVAAVGSGTVIGNSSGTGSTTTSNGTSFSAPQIAGLLALLWQAYPTLTAQQIITALKKSGHQASAPDNLLGYGVPSGSLANEIIKNDYLLLGTEPDLLNNIILSPNPAQADLTLTIPTSLVGQKSTISLFMQNGKSVFTQQKNLTDSENIPVDKLSAGLYLVKIDVQNRSKTIKFIKQ